MKQTKKQLIKEKTESESTLLLQENKDKARRQEFAKAFNWFKPETDSIYTMSINRKLDPITPSWEEIFIEVGKLLAKEDFRKFKDAINRGETELTNFDSRLRELENNKIK